MQVQRQVHAIALHLARQDGIADAIGQLADLGAFGDAGGGERDVGREGLGLLPFVVLQQGGDVRARRVGGTDRLGRGQVPGQRAVVAHQPAAAGGTDLVQRHGLGPVGLGEGQAPVSLGDGFGQFHGQGLGVFGQALHAVLHVLLGAVQGLLRQWQFTFDHLAQGVPDDLPLVFRGQRGAEQQHARVVQVGRGGAHVHGVAGLDQLLVERAVGFAREHLGQQGQGHGVARCTGRRVIAGKQQRHTTRAAHHHFALALLGGVQGVGLDDGRFRARDAAECFLHGGQRAVHVELAGDDQHRVVGAVVAPVEVLQVVGRDSVKVGERTDDGTAVGMEAVGGGHELVVEHRAGPVLVGFHLVDDDRALALELAGIDADVLHRVGQPGQHPVARGVAGVELAEVIGAVIPGGAVPVDAAPGQLLLGIGNLLGTLEEHVLQQVRHAGFARPFVARSHLVDQIDGHGGLGFVRTQQHGQAVGELVLGDAVDGLAHLHDAGDVRGRGGFDRGHGGGGDGGFLGLDMGDDQGRGNAQTQHQQCQPHVTQQVALSTAGRATLRAAKAGMGRSCGVDGRGAGGCGGVRLRGLFGRDWAQMHQEGSMEDGHPNLNGRFRGVCRVGTGCCGQARHTFQR